MKRCALITIGAAACILPMLGYGSSSQRGAADRYPTTPTVFAPGIISTGKEFGLTFMPNGAEAYFTRFDAEKRTNHIYHTLLIDGQWQTPTQVEFSRDEWRDLDPAVTPDGKRLFFISTRPKPGSDPNQRSADMDIWVSDRQGNGWGAPRLVENVNSEAKEGSPSASRDGTLYFFSDRGAAANNNSIYSADLVNGKYASPKRLPNEVNAGPSDTSPFISPNGKTLLFYSTRPGGSGKGDLYVASKKQGSWSQAVNLGPKVNTQDSEYNPSTSPDGEQLYFGRNREIYVISVRALSLESLKPALFR